MTIDYSKIKVLYRKDDSLALYGIPYKMNREIGQQPRDIWEGFRDLRKASDPRGHGAPEKYAWIYLGVPGAETPETLAWLATLADVPGNPHEWCEVEPK